MVLPFFRVLELQHIDYESSGNEVSILRQYQGAQFVAVFAVAREALDLDIETRVSALERAAETVKQ